MKNKLISVIGLGYIGLPTAALLASHGYSVLGTDISFEKVESINKGETYIFEPDLKKFVQLAVASGRLNASTLVQPADIYIICVPTPVRDGDEYPEPEIKSVVDATLSIAPFIKSGDLIILESTSPVGTTEKIEVILRDCGAPVADINIAYCPERVLPGNIMNELVENDRIVGGLTINSTKAASDFYRTFVHGDVFETNARTAELCKLAENSYRDVNIAFANELSMICDIEAINVWDLIQLANQHPRVNILQPGPGVGGHCIAIDPWFIVSRVDDNAQLIRSAREVNNFKTEWVIEKTKTKIFETSSKINRKPKIACLGLSFKPDIDDLRESPALHVSLTLQSEGYKVLSVEPNIISHESLSIVSLEEALVEADIFIILVKHQQFVVPDVKNILKRRMALDFCGALL